MGLDLGIETWLIFGGCVVLWGTSVLLAGNQEERLCRKWRIIPLSFFGFAWISFCTDYIFRFLLLVADAELFQATQFPFWLMPDETVRQTWTHAGVYWLCVCLGYSLFRMRPRGKSSQLLARVEICESSGGILASDLLAVISVCSIVILYGLGHVIPRSLQTPLGALSNFWVIPAALAWFKHFTSGRGGNRRFVFLIPGFITYFLSPYREHVVKAFLCFLVPALLTRAKWNPVKVVGFAIALVLVLTPINTAYRQAVWGNIDRWSAPGEFLEWQNWADDPQKAPWVAISKRIHGFDSSALTFLLIPAEYSYDTRNIFTELLASAFLPSMLFSEKIHVDRAPLFSEKIWSYGIEGFADRVNAMIAPSMLGDLWSAGGSTNVILGAFIWGVLIGFLDYWRRSLAPGTSAAILVFFALLVWGGIERDFVLAVSTIVQQAILLTFLILVLPARWRVFHSLRSS